MVSGEDRARHAIQECNAQRDLMKEMNYLVLGVLDVTASVLNPLETPERSYL
jgi:hypothetical protein